MSQYSIYENNALERLLARLDRSTSPFMAADSIISELEEAGFTLLEADASWEGRSAGNGYYTVINGTAVVAWIEGEGSPAEHGFRIIASHSDSPCFKIKPNAEIYGDGGVVSLNVEKYGGGIMYTWFDRPLSVSGRVMLRGADPFSPVTRLVDLERPVATIPHLAIHFNRGVNEGNALSVQKDMKPVAGYFPDEVIREMKQNGGLVRMLLADALEVAVDDILDYELCLYPCEPAGLAGTDGQYFQSARIDDLSMAFASLDALLCSMDAGEEAADMASGRPTRVMAVFDNEETGSGTKQGAHSPWLRWVLERLCGGDTETFHRAVARSFMISADDAHAWHPNYNEKYDPTNHPVIGGGPVVKVNANCKYMTDADGAAVFRALCEEAGVPCQTFVNHGDVAGGSTLGNILTSQLPLRGVDVGNAIWAMHSARETAGVSDQEAMVRVMTRFYSRR